MASKTKPRNNIPTDTPKPISMPELEKKTMARLNQIINDPKSADYQVINAGSAVLAHARALNKARIELKKWKENHKLALAALELKKNPPHLQKPNNVTNILLQGDATINTSPWELSEGSDDIEKTPVALPVGCNPTGTKDINDSPEATEPTTIDV
jgi:hypothetical protein